jgi:hypothetical protein
VVLFWQAMATLHLMVRVFSAERRLSFRAMATPHLMV